MNTDLLTLMETRRSVRRFKPDMLPSDVIDQIIKAGTYAATGMNRQSPIIIAVTNKEMRDRLSKMNASRACAGTWQLLDPQSKRRICLPGRPANPERSWDRRRI